MRCSSAATPADVEREVHLLRESKMLLVSTAEKIGLVVPRSCCHHRGAEACISCSSDWLVAHVRLTRRAVN
ncbi:MAG: hypothetical protein ABSC93_09785 [Bryobacteraceae bacterium]